MNYRIGFGYDVHPLKDGEDFRLGGIKLDHTKGAVGHSDADALIHALCDALLGAAGLGDIGTHFPDSSSDFKNIDSKVLLKRVVSFLSENDYSIGNVDVTVCLEKPKIAPYISSMKTTLANTMNIGENLISIKATTNEKMGFVGREDGVAAYAVALIYTKANQVLG